MTSRRFFLRLSIFLFLLVILFAAILPAADFSYLVYVGTYTDKQSKGIYAYRFDPGSGESEAVGLVATTDLNGPASLARIRHPSSPTWPKCAARQRDRVMAS